MDIQIILVLLVPLAKAQEFISWDDASKNCSEDKKDESILVPKHLLETQVWTQREIMKNLTNGSSAWIDGEIFKLKQTDGFLVEVLKIALPPESSYPYIDVNGIVSETNMTYDDIISQNIELASIHDVFNGGFTLKEGSYWINNSKGFEFIDRKCIGLKRNHVDLEFNEYQCDEMMRAVCIEETDLKKSYHIRSLLKMVAIENNSLSAYKVLVLDKNSTRHNNGGEDLIPYPFRTEIRKQENETKPSRTITNKSGKVSQNLTTRKITSYPNDFSLGDEFRTLKSYIIGISVAMALCFVGIIFLTITQFIICQRFLLTSKLKPRQAKKQSVYGEVLKVEMEKLRPTSSKNTMLARDSNFNADFPLQSSLYETANDNLGGTSVSYGNLLPFDPNDSVLHEGQSDNESVTETGVKEIIENEAVKKSNDYTSFV